VSFFEKIIAEALSFLIFDVLWEIFRQLGASVRQLFLRKKYTIHELLKQNWNGRVGLFVVGIVVVTIIFIL
jgi:hypothetical protein